MKIAIKTQTSRATNYKENLNCVNVFLQDRFSDTKFEMGLQVTEWGDNKPIEPIITISFGDKDYRFTVESLRTQLIMGEK